MASRPTDGPEGPQRRSEELRARRAERKRQIRRRRLVAGGALVAGVGAALAVVVITGSGGSGSGGRRAGLTEAIPDSHVLQGPGVHAKRISRDDPRSLFKVRNSTPQPDWEPHTGPVPILEYHVLGEAPADAPYPELYVERPDFRHQLEWLDEHGYQAVTLEQVESAWYEGGTLPPKPVVLSFDDGYRPQFTFALPQLRKHGWAGVLNLKAEGSDLYESTSRR